MKYQVKTLAIITTITMAASSSVYAGCEWTHGSLGQTIKTTSVRLKQYSECKTNCGQLESGLASTVALMNTSKECGPDVLTAKNKQMVEFFDRRFKLIRKLKRGELFSGPIAPSKPTQVEPRETTMSISSGVYQDLWDETGSQKQKPQALQQRVQQQRPAAKPMPSVVKQVTKVVQPAQQLAPAQQVQPVKQQVTQVVTPSATPAVTSAQQQAAEQRRIALQRQIQQQKQAQIERQNKRNAEARKRKILLIQHQERIRQKQLQFERARVLYLAKQKARQQQLAREQK